MSFLEVFKLFHSSVILYPCNAIFKSTAETSRKLKVYRDASPGMCKHLPLGRFSLEKGFIFWTGQPRGSP